jgi:hypothetical protein
MQQKKGCLIPTLKKRKTGISEVKVIVRRSLDDRSAVIVVSRMNERKQEGYW